MNNNAATDQKHRSRTQNRQCFHHVRCKRNQKRAKLTGDRRCCGTQIQTQIVQLDNPRHQTVDTNRHDHRNTGKHYSLRRQRLRGYNAQGNRNDFSRQDKVGAYCAFDFVFFKKKDTIFLLSPHPLTSFFFNVRLHFQSLISFYFSDKN